MAELATHPTIAPSRKVTAATIGAVISGAAVQLLQDWLEVELAESYQTLISLAGAGLGAFIFGYLKRETLRRAGALVVPYLLLGMLMLAGPIACATPDMIAAQERFLAAETALAAESKTTTRLAALALDARSLDRYQGDIMQWREERRIGAGEFVMIAKDLNDAEQLLGVMAEAASTDAERAQAKLGFDRKLARIAHWHGQWRARAPPAAPSALVIPRTGD